MVAIERDRCCLEGRMLKHALGIGGDKAAFCTIDFAQAFR
jgi:hypothetical protein